METSVFDTAAVLMVLAAFFGWVNHRWLKLPFAIGLLISALLASVAVLGFDRLVPELDLGAHVRDAMVSIDFTEALLHGMLSFLLFAGALHVDLSELLEKLKPHSKEKLEKKIAKLQTKFMELYGETPEADEAKEAAEDKVNDAFQIVDMNK